MAATIIPGKTPCFACWAPEPELTASCSEAGVDIRAVDAAANALVEEALAILGKKRRRLAGKLFFFDSEKNRSAIVDLKKNSSCDFCSGRKTLVKEMEAVRACGTDQWFFLNPAPREAKLVFSRLGGVKRKKFGNSVKMFFPKAEATLLPTGAVLVRAAEKKDAIAANEAILRKIS